MWLEGTPRRNMEYEGFLQMLEENGHNFLRFWSWMHTLFDPQPFARHASSPPDSGQPLAGSRVPGYGPANDGQPRFDLSVWNDAYFSRLRERVEQAMRRGIYTGVMLFEAPTGSHPATGACSSIATIPRRRTAAK
jgi:hypothetical protein